MALPHTSKISFLNNRGEEIQEPSEWEFLTIELKIEEYNWENVNVYFQNQKVDIYLKKIKGQKKVLAELGRLNAGHYTIKYELFSQQEEYKFTVFPSKISQIAFTGMVNDLIFRLPADISISLNNLGAFAGINLLYNQETTIAQEFLRLKRAIEGTEKRLGLINILRTLSNPHKILKTNDVWVEKESARRPHPAKLIQAFALAGNINSFGIPSKVLDTRVEHSFNIYENQLIKMFYNQVYLRFRRVLAILRSIEGKQILNEAEELFKELEKTYKNATFLNEVNIPHQFLAKTTMVLIKIPSYRSALEGFLEFQRTATINLDEPALDSPLENTPELYQKWGTLQVLSSLLKVAIDLGYQIIKQNIARRSNGLLTVKILPDGKPAVELEHPKHKTVVKLIPERSYGKGNDLKSISFLQKPDIVIEVKKPNGDFEVYLFDPKYKLDSETNSEESIIEKHAKPKKVDIDKMHAYRDSIRDSNGKRVVKYASILYPGEKNSFTENLEALKAYPTEDEELQQRLLEICKEALCNNED